MRVGTITFMLTFMKHLSIYAERTGGRLDTWGGFLPVKKIVPQFFKNWNAEYCSEKFQLFFFQEEVWESDFSVTTSYFKIHYCYQFWCTELKALVIICDTLNQTLSSTKLWATLLMNIHRKTKNISCHEKRRIYLFAPV